MSAAAHDGSNQSRALNGGVDLLLAVAEEKGWAKVRPPFEPPAAVPVEQRDEVYAAKAAKWCAKSLEGYVGDLAGMAPDTGRNHALNAAAWRMFRYVLAGHLDGDSTADALRDAALACGLGNGEIEGTMGSARSAAERDGPLEPPISPGEQPDPFAGLEVPGDVDESTGEVLPTTSTVVVVEPASPLEPVGVGDFWQSRAALTHVQTFARARLCSPWSVLGVVMARVVTATPHFVVLPDLVGSYASLNLFTALVGPSGGGKGASESAAADCITLTDVNGDDIETATVGSGEGIGHLYAHREKGEVVRDRHAVLFTVPEVDNLTALAGRQGATLLPQLRSAWSGEKLGFAYADKAKALPIERHTYRMGLVLGVQPGRAGALLDDADGGTPQRFLWMPTSDKEAPDEPPACPEPLTWSLAGRWTADPFANGLVVMSIPDIARQTIARNRLSRLREQGEALDGHALLTRLKAAAALALLDERREVNEQDWELAGKVMAISDATRASVVQYLSGKAREINRQKGEAEGSRAVLVQEKVNDAHIKRVARKVLTHLHRTGEMVRSDVRRAIAARDRQYFDDAVDRLVEAGAVVLNEARMKAAG